MDDTNYYGSVDENEFRFGIWKGETFFALSNFVVDITLEVNSESGNLSGYIFRITYHGRVLGLVMHTLSTTIVIGKKSCQT